MTSRHSVTTRLVGGLGNQLFCYYAGAALAAHLGVDLRLDVSWTRHGITDHGIEILKFDLPGQWQDERSGQRLLGPPGSIRQRAVARALREWPALGRPARIHHGVGTGDDPRLFEQPPGTRLRGYFQSWRIVQRAVEAGYPRRPRLREGSPWLDQMIGRIAEEQPIVVHVRRGDYLTTSDFETLGPSYYEKALDLARSKGFNGPVWLFSDDPNAATETLGRIIPDDVAISPDGPATELLALSHAPARIIANSTFSWWSAWMADASSLTIMPARWFAGRETPDELVPAGWWRNE